MIATRLPRQPLGAFRNGGPCVPLALYQFSEAMAADLDRARVGYGTTHSEVVPILLSHGWKMHVPASGRYPTIDRLLIQQQNFTGLVTGRVSGWGRSAHHMVAIRDGVMLDETGFSWEEEPLSMIWLPPENHDVANTTQ